MMVFIMDESSFRRPSGLGWLQLSEKKACVFSWKLSLTFRGLSESQFLFCCGGLSLDEIPSCFLTGVGGGDRAFGVFDSAHLGEADNEQTSHTLLPRWGAANLKGFAPCRLLSGARSCVVFFAAGSAGFLIPRGLARAVDLLAAGFVIF